MPTFGNAFRLGKTQPELDFVDVRLDRDNRLFVDPFAIAQQLDPWSQQAAATIGVFFQQVVEDIKAGREQSAVELLSHLREPNETRLGLSRKRPRGAGIGSGQAAQIYTALRESSAVKTGFISGLEEAELMIEGIGHDKISDLTTNVIRNHLVEYTQAQCDLHGVPLQQASLPPMFNPDAMRWESRYVLLPVWRSQAILLVPKSIVRYSPAYHHGHYYQHFVLNFLQAEELSNPRLGLVRVITNKKLKSQRRVVYKTDLAEKFPRSKELLYEFSRDHPEVLARYREALTRAERSDRGSEVDTEDERVIAEALAAVMRQTRRGTENAAAYHHLMIGIVEFIFYPKLVHPRGEQKIHQGRKRIDIVVENSAHEGIFNVLPNVRRIPCPYVAIECKNYGGEVGNPELDQLGGRFSVNRGKVGMLCCREFQDRQLFVQRCRDTFRDDRGLILPIDDGAVLAMLDMIGKDARNQVDSFVSDLVREVAYD